jgi:hypothetical protein
VGGAGCTSGHQAKDGLLTGLADGHKAGGGGGGCGYILASTAMNDAVTSPAALDW